MATVFARLHFRTPSPGRSVGGRVGYGGCVCNILRVVLKSGPCMSLCILDVSGGRAVGRLGGRRDHIPS